MKQTLQLKLSQHFTLTPQLQQSIRLLQLSTLELNQELERFLAENPLLEREEIDDDGDAPPRINGAQQVAEPAPERAAAPESAAPPEDERRADADWYLESGGSGAGREEGDESDYPQLAAESPSLRDHLLQQLSLTPLPDRDRRLVAMLVVALDEDGHLTQPLEEIAEMLPPELGVEADDLTIANRADAITLIQREHYNVVAGFLGMCCERLGRQKVNGRGGHPRRTRVRLSAPTVN